MRPKDIEKTLQTIREICSKHNISAYEIAEYTGLNPSGLHRILTGETQNPRSQTIEKIVDFIEKKGVGRNVEGHKNYVKNFKHSIKVNEDDSQYQNDTVLNAIASLRNMIQGNHNLIGKALETLILNTDEIKDETGGLKNRLNNIDTGMSDLSALINQSHS